MASSGTTDGRLPGVKEGVKTVCDGLIARLGEVDVGVIDMRV